MLDFLQTYMIGTPDFGHSDIWHFNFALKFLFGEALKSGYFPFWTKDIGTGFPLLGEGQIGMFNLYNFLSFKFLDPVLAFNLGLAVIFVTTLLGTYLFSRRLKLNRLASFFSAVLFSFSGVFVTQVVHYNLIQSASFMPWLFFLSERFLQTKQKRHLVFFSLILSQQIFSGFQQLVMISLISLAVFLLVRCQMERSFKKLAPIGIAVFFGVLLSLPQIIPSWQFERLSFRGSGLPLSTLSQFPFHPLNFLGFINPYFSGDPRNGSYKPFSSNWGIFWETTGYIGILPLFLAALALLTKSIRKSFRPILILLPISLVLLLGKFTPLFFLYQLPPLSLFRVPARFLFPFVFTLTILAGAGLTRLPKKLAIAILVISFLDLGNFVVHYHAVINARDWLKPPESAAFLKKDQSWFRIFSVPPYSQWNATFLLTNGQSKLTGKGWQNMAAYYPLRNALDPNQNLYWDLSAVDSYVGLNSRRGEYFTSLAVQTIRPNPTTKTLEIASQSAKLLSLAGAKYFLSPYRIGESDLAKTHTTFLFQTAGSPSFYIYQNQNALPHAYLTRNYLVAQTIADLERKITDPTNSAAVLEESVPVEKAEVPIVPARVIKNEDLEVEIQASASAQSLLILSDSYYPGWKAYIDQQPTRIIPANLNQRAVILPKGYHTINFVYNPF